MPKENKNLGKKVESLGEPGGENLDTHILGEPGHPHLSRTWQNLDTHILEN
jgi:hypothetical protein